MLAFWLALSCKDTDLDTAAVPGGELWYADADGDGFGDGQRVFVSEQAPSGWVSADGDCDDGDPDASPAATEVCGNAVDEDCDGCAVACVDETQLCGLAVTTIDGATGARLGESLAVADTDGDGDDELLIGAPLYSDGAQWTGAVLVGELVVSGSDPADGAGSAVAGVGDVDGDGLEDVLVGAWREDTATSSDSGAAWLLLGPLTGGRGGAEADAWLRGDTPGGWAGRSVAGAGDVDGDGYADLLVGAPRQGEMDLGGGAASLVYGPVTGEVALADADASITGSAALGAVGWSVSGAGDTDGDGLADVIVGAPGGEGGQAVVLAGPLSGALSLSDGRRLAGQTGAMGWSVAGLGDIDGDGLADVIVGSPEAGTAEIFLGGTIQPWGRLIGEPETGRAVLAGPDGQVLVASAGCLYLVTPISGTTDLTDARCGESVGGVALLDGQIAVGLPQQDAVLVLGVW